MRLTFLILLLLNGVFFAWSRYFSASQAEVPSGGVPREIAPEKLRIIPPGALAQKQIGIPALPASMRTSPSSSAACLEWGTFVPGEAARAERALEPLGLAARVAQRRVAESVGWWVFIPPQGSRQNAAKKAAELKELGVGDYFIVGEEGVQHWALSLGVFRTQEAAHARLAALQSQGVHDAQVGPRDASVSKVWLRIQPVDGPVQMRLKEIAADAPGTELRACREDH